MKTAGSENFNRYTLEYSSDVPLHGCITYVVGGEEIHDEFFMEAGNNITFRSFIIGFADGKTADLYKDIDIKTLENGSFNIDTLTFDTAAGFSGDTYYIENENYRVGIELAWGGGLSYIADKHSPEPSLGNLLNRFDTGRLVQQSYYGTGEAPYVCGEFMGNRWCYNPVQGGDKANNKSRLIDAEITGNGVYVKCRPRDWGHNGSYTISYMENRYILDGEYIRVDNRFIDYSGYIHGRSSQEVPAFYTVSYLGNFWFYGGSKPWTGDTLDVRRDLIFWPEDWPRHTFDLPAGDTETWCAWTDDNDYGIGLYVPGVTRFIGGRYMFDASKDPKSASTNYVAPVRFLTLKSYKPLEYSYLISIGSLGMLRERFVQSKDFTDNKSLVDY